MNINLNVLLKWKSREVGKYILTVKLVIYSRVIGKCGISGCFGFVFIVVIG